MNNYHYIIDCSYIVYFSIFSAWKEYVVEQDIPKSQQRPEFDPTVDPEFNYLFYNKFKNAVIRPIQKIIPFVDGSRFIMALDCPRKSIWRRKFYPEYKIQRDLKDTSKDPFDLNAVFKYANNHIIPNFCDEFGASVVKCPVAEGDDVIAVLTNEILNKSPHNKLIIVSCDKDMVQLYNDRVIIITSEGEVREPKKELESAIKMKIEGEITSSDFLLFKILLGDSADNIPNIKPGVGKKKAYKLMSDKDALKALLASDNLILEGFKRNKKLISMKEIPEEVKQLIIESAENVLSSFTMVKPISASGDVFNEL